MSVNQTTGRSVRTKQLLAEVEAVDTTLTWALNVQSIQIRFK
jgi:hypothetical protein